jgi:ABC-type dipeptide/oligopeptide/nickel transport system permease component
MTSIARFIARRILQAVPLLFAVITINFLIIHTAPGDPTYILLGETATPEFVQAMRARFGLDKPLYLQYFYYISQIVQGDLGFSVLRAQTVSSLILERLPATLVLIFAAMAISTSVGLFLGVTASRQPYSTRDNIATGIALFGVSTPTFWLGQVLLIVFAIYAGLFPTSGMTDIRLQLTGFELVLDIARHLLLPAITLAAFHLAFITRLTRASMLEVLSQDYIITARSKGLDDRTVVYRHGLRNALLPVTTYVGLSVGLLFGGAILTETVFGWPGMGSLLYDSLRLRDYPVLLGIFIFIAVMVVIADLIVDVLYGVLDPRIRSG